MLSWIAALVAVVILYKQGATNMGIGQDILAKAQELDAKVDALIAAVKAHEAAGEISPEVAASILSTIQGTEDKADAETASQ